MIVHRAEGDGGQARACLEDDFHHFQVAVTHEFEQVVRVDASAIRHPYTLCPSAAGQLQKLSGMRLDRVASSVTRFADASQQCTHLLDLTGLALAAAAARRVWREYLAEVDDRVEGRTRAQLQRDGVAILEWQVRDTTLTGPPPFAGVSLHAGFSRWVLETLSADDAEAAIVLRRCAVISRGRGKNLDAQLHAVASGHCYAQQAHRAEQALRVVGSTLDFSSRAQELCAQDADWLAFR